MNDKVPHLPRPDIEAGFVDELLEAAASGIVFEGDYRYKTEYGVPSKVELLKIFSGDFKGKLSSWRNASQRQGTPKNQLHRTEDLIAIFGNVQERLYGVGRPLVPLSKKQNFIEFYNFLSKNRTDLLSDTQEALRDYKRHLIENYSDESSFRKISSGFRVNDDRVSADRKESPSQKFADAVLAYTRHLKDSHRNHMVVEIRNKISRIFHLIGMNREREELGRLALEATFVSKDPISRAEILIDDLGWALHLMGRTDEASGNISDAIGLLVKLQNLSPDLEVRSGLAIAKGYRHQALFSTKRRDSEELIAKGEVVIIRLKQNDVISSLFSSIIKQDEAQFLHARSLLIARDLGIETTGSIEPASVTETEQAKTARELARTSADYFSEIGDMERQAKALNLLERLQEALGERMSAVQTKAVREDIQARSGMERAIRRV